MKNKKIFKEIWFYFALLYTVAFFIFLILGITLKDWSYLYGYLLYMPFGAFSSFLMYFVEKKKVSKSNVLITWIARYFLKCVPIILCAILYSVDIEQINIIGILIGVIISLLESIVFGYFTYIRISKSEPNN